MLHVKNKIILTNEKIKILSKYDIFIVTSNHEGICISAIELLSMGVIGIIRNSYIEAKNLIPKQYQNILLVSPDANINEYIKKINYIKNMPKNIKNELRINLMNHIKNNFSKEIFVNNWNKILKKFI